MNKECEYAEENIFVINIPTKNKMVGRQTRTHNETNQLQNTYLCQ